MGMLSTLPTNSDELIKIATYKFRRWRHLKVWKMDLTDVQFSITKGEGAETAGLATKDNITIDAGSNVADLFSTIIHELAHVVRIKEDLDYSHGVEFMRLFLEAAESIVKHKIKVDGHTYSDVHRAIARVFAEHFGTPRPRL